MRDRVYVYLDGTYLGTLDRQHKIRQMPVTARQGQVLTLFVESQGRVSFGPDIRDSKGLVGPVMLGGRTLNNWVHKPLGNLMPWPNTDVTEEVSGGNVTTAKGEMTWYHGSYNVTTPQA